MNFDFHVLFAFLSALFFLASIVPYVQGILKQKVRPNLVSFSGWGLLALIATLAQLAEGVTWPLVASLSATINCFIVVAFAIKFGYIKFSTLDKVAIGLGIMSLALWSITREPLVALILVVLTDIIVSIPTIVKSYHYPESEDLTAWSLSTIGALLAILTISTFDLANVLYPIWLLFSIGTIMFFVLRGVLKRKNIV